MDVCFLGTSGNLPTKTRSSSCVALSRKNDIWVFDCGEGSYKNLQASVLNSYLISKIFITHMHADHLLGLPGLLMSIINLRTPEQKKTFFIDLYGPRGLKQYIQSNFELLNTSKLLKYIHFHEFPNFLHNACIPIYEDSSVTVKGAYIHHTIECLGYIIEEKVQDMNPVSKYINNHKNELTDYLSSIKQQEISNQINSHSIHKIVLLGDTDDASSIMPYAQNTDILIHECTLLGTPTLLEQKSGHSNASMAGSFAKSINAHNLILTHFSRKLNNVHGSEYTIIFDMAKEQYEKDSIIMAHDNLVITS
ncbi:hypothetical protein WA158_000191 [Blastocystis sp. Blastoise]